MAKREPQFVDEKLSASDYDRFQRFRDHYRQRPLRWHFGAWLLVGLTLGFLIAPDMRLSSLVAYTFSGSVCCILLALLTYPFSDHYRLTLFGAGAGFLLSPLCMWIVDPEQPLIGVGQLGLVTGALSGATSLVWLGPLRYLRRMMMPAMETTAIQPEQSARF
jgi:uncharacterized membrane protein YfcA